MPSHSKLEPQQPMKWYLPTFHGDILLERKADKVTLVRVFELTAREETALQSLRLRATRPTLGRKPWASDAEFEPVSSAQYRTKSGLVLTLKASIKDVEKVLAKALKPTRALLCAVRFSGGRIEEVVRGPEEEDDKPSTALAVKTPDKDPKKEPELLEAELEPPPKSGGKIKAEAEPKAAVTVAKPRVGCPMPDFPEADVRASRVLEAFLTPEQTRDYRQHGAFIAQGADSGHRYMVANRETPQRIRQCQGRQLFDLEEGRPLCVHDWEVPPPEEMLALLLCLTLPGHERFIREMPETFAR